MGSDATFDDANDNITLSSILSRLNGGRSKKDAVARADVEKVLVDLEEQNKVMYIQDGEDPMVMLI